MLKFSMWDRALEWLYRSDPWSHSLNNFIVEESSNLFAPSRVENIYCVAVVKIVSYNNNILSPPVAENYIFSGLNWDFIYAIIHRICTIKIKIIKNKRLPSCEEERNRNDFGVKIELG